MRNTTLWNEESILAPWRGLMDLQRNLDRVLEKAWDESREARKQTDTFVQPACDVEETDSHYLMSIDLPGVAKKDLSVEFKDGHVFVRAERKSESKARRFAERYFGKFHRVIALPSDADAEKIEAQYQDGVLTLAVAKAEAAKARRVEISEGKSSFLGRLVGGAKEAGKEGQSSPVSAA